jgi:hypothetical protein
MYFVIAGAAASSLYIAYLHSSRLPRDAAITNKQTPMENHRSFEKTK